ncbi:MAG: hypothetical protein E7055_05970 [Lentisphaerae bacterium]|nr:hypothetical protein [Lentisphaerota bacterium]
MKLDFRIEWGYQILYSRRHYHPQYIWDGHLDCEKGRLESLSLYHYPRCISGPVNCPRETPLTGNSWQETTRRALSGLHVKAEAEPDAVFHLVTASGNFDFTARQIAEEGRIVFDVGPKYGNCHVTVIRTGFLWFRPAPRAGETGLDAESLPLPVHDWERMRSAWLEPGGTVRFSCDLTQGGEQIFHLIAMGANHYDPETENVVCDTFPMVLKCDGRIVAEFKHYFRKHYVVQILEDVWARFQAAAGTHEFELVNANPRFPLLINRVSFIPSRMQAEELVLPRWVIAGEKVFGRIHHTGEPVTCEVKYIGKVQKLKLEPGWNEFPFTLDEPGQNVEFVTDTGLRGTVAEVWSVPAEKHPLMAGSDLTSVPHDDSGEMEWLLDYMNRTRMGNLIVIRSHLFHDYAGKQKRDPDDALLEKWGKYCLEHRIHVEAATDYESGTLAKAAGEMMHAAGKHELTGRLYAFDPDHELRPESMREAAENYVAFLREKTDEMHRSVQRVGLGDASGGQRYCYQGGVDYIRAETMVPNTMHLCSLARTASEAMSDGTWGVHIATQHAMQPYFMNQLGLFFLSLYQSWMMGANMFYEEDSLFVMWKEERQCWDDALTRGKRDMLRDFYHFIMTHPRQGHSCRPIAFLEGRYAAPFNGFVCGGNQDPHYSVWGQFGRDLPEWGHGQPEKCRQLLDVLMPGCLTHPLRQKYEKQRHFFAGTPFGDFDEVPVEAGADFFRQYRLLLNLGWNTLIPEDYEKLCGFVREGGTLLTGLPQFGTQEKRDFSDFRLFRGGDLSELCGIKVFGPAGHEFSGQWNCAARQSVPEVELSAMPSDDPGEDGPCRLASVELAGAEVVAWDAVTALPLLTSFRYGKGKVYVITAWAYPGHEALQKFSAAWISKLARENRGDWFADDPSREVFWSVRRFDDPRCGQLFMLNTDWTQPGNRKKVAVHAGGLTFDYDVTERVPAMLTVAGSRVLETAPENYLEYRGVHGNAAEFSLHSCGKASVTIRSAAGTKEIKLQTAPGGAVFSVDME